MKHQVLVTGLGGYIGRYLFKHAPRDVVLSGTSRDPSHIRSSFPVPDAIKWHQLDLEQPAGPQLKSWEGDLIIHAAAQAGLKYCQQHPDEAFRINADGTAHLARWAADRSVRMVYLSTDIVFRGDQPPYAEESLPDPVNIYGASKAEGERKVADVAADGVIVRVALTLGHALGPSVNFVDWFLRKLDQGERIPLFEDEIRTPLYAGILAQALWDIALGSESGVFHLCGSEPVDRYRLGRLFCDHLGRGHELLQAVSMHQMSDYPRPVDVSMQAGRKIRGNTIRLPGISKSISELFNFIDR